MRVALPYPLGSFIYIHFIAGMCYNSQDGSSTILEDKKARLAHFRGQKTGLILGVAHHLFHNQIFAQFWLFKSGFCHSIEGLWRKRDRDSL